MKISILALSLAYAHAFAPSQTGRTSPVKPLKKMADDVGIPCEDECALSSFPNLPESIHPGVLSGQAMMDLLNHAKENGKYDFSKFPRKDPSLGRKVDLASLASTLTFPSVRFVAHLLGVSLPQATLFLLSTASQIRVLMLV